MTESEKKETEKKPAYPFMLSIVTAVYNTAPFLEEMLDSVLNQNTAPLEGYLKSGTYKDIYEFILVDDGSTDGSGKILDEYSRRFPQIKVIHKENGGVSSARNAGIDIASGKYITFPDSDDKLGKDYLAQCLSFFEEHEEELFAICVPVKLFDAKKGDHWLNYKYTDDNRVINFEEEPDAVTYSVNAEIMRTEDFQNRRFSTELKIGEDMAVFNDILIDTGLKLGAVGKTCYYYRKRSSGEPSALDNEKYMPEAYVPLMRDVFEAILLKAKDKYGYVPKHIQYCVMGQLQWRYAIADGGKSGLAAAGKEGYAKFKELAISMLQYMDDDVIVAQRIAESGHKYYMLKKKWAKPALVPEGGKLYFEFGDVRIPRAFEDIYIRFDNIRIRKGVLHIDGYTMDYEPDAGVSVYVNKSPAAFTPVKKDADRYTFDDVFMYAHGFFLDIPLERKTWIYRIEIHSLYKGFDIIRGNFRYDKCIPLSDKKKTFYTEEGWMIKKEGSALDITSRSNA